MLYIILSIMGILYKNKAFALETVGDDVYLRNKYGVYSKKELEAQLLAGHLTVDELGDLYSLKSYQMVHVLRSLGIIFRNNVNDTRVFDSTITPSIHQVLLGTLLGDAYMPGKYYCVGHGVSQMDYCYHVAERIHPFVASFGDFNTPCKTEKSFSFWTYRHDIFVPYFKRFYSHGLKKKFFTEETIPDLEAEGLAYWYMDDGKYGEFGSYLCVGNITELEGNILRGILKQKFGLETTFQVHDKKKNYHTIYIKAESRDKFFSLIDPYVIPSMRYKMEGTPFPRIEFSPDLIYSRHLELCKKSGRFIRYFGDEEISKKVEATPFLKGEKESYLEKIRTAIRNGAQISKTELRKLPDAKEFSDLLSQGMCDGGIAKKYNVSRNKIAKLRKSLGIQDLRSRLTYDQEIKLKALLSSPETSIQQIMDEVGISYYRAKEYMGKNKENKCHQRVMKEEKLQEDLKNLPFDPLTASISEYIFSLEPYTPGMGEFLKSYEWLKSVGVYSKWCFTMRLRGYLAGVQVLNEPTSYSKILGPDTMKYECLIQRGCTVSWAHEHLGSKMLMAAINWMVQNTEKRIFVGYSDRSAGEVGILYQACNFMYLGDKFGITVKYKHPTYHEGKEFCAHSLKRTGILKWWCRQNGIVMDKSWFKPNGFKDLKVLPSEIKQRWYDWAKKLISESVAIPVDSKGKYALIRGKDKREQRYLLSLFKEKTFPYPKREIQPI